VGAIGSARDVARRIRAYHEAGADHIGVAPSTAEDPAGRSLLAALL
jgi:alkanesulfonate monooxygenase SsuD/methylene tetrahydromethanopterin reductase-like flavin-dependent oxidoreductase (luciferase family)